MHPRQKGAALMMALVILLIMTLIGLSSLQTSQMDMRIVGNLKESTTAFHVAETALELTMATVTEGGNIENFQNAITDDSGSVTVDVSTDLDMSGTSSSVNILASGVGEYATGSSVGKFKPMQYTLTADVERTGSRAKSTHQRGFELLIPGT